MSDDIQQPVEPQVEQVEKEARIFGWVPKEEYRGSETEWVDAETFVKRGKEINPILRKNNETLLKKLDEKSKEIESIKASVEEFKQFQKEAFERKQQEYEVQIAELKAKKKEAIAEGNGELVVDIDDQIDEIKEAQREAKQDSKKPVEQPKQEATQDPELNSWIDRNEWFGKDQEMTDIANGLGASVRRQFPHLSGRAFLDKLDERLQARFPNEFGGKQQRTSPVDSGSNVRGDSSGKKKTYDNLPSEAKAACDKFVKQGLFKSRQDYVDLYDWS